MYISLSERSIAPRWTWLTTCLWASAAGLVGLAAAQSSPPESTFSDSTTTLLVEVPVEVTLDGEPVRGLSMENFELFDDGDRVSIQGVEEIDLSRISASTGEGIAPVDLPVIARRHFLLLFDTSFASPVALTKARQSAHELVTRDLHPADLVAVATYGLNSGIRIPLGFTTDRAQVILALQALGAPQSVAVRSDPLRLYVGNSRSPDLGAEPAIQGSASGERGAMIEGQMRTLQNMADRAQAAQGRREVSAMTRSFSELASMLRSVDGRKHVVFFSEGFDSELLLGSVDEERRTEMVRQAQDNALWEVDSSEYFGSADTLNVLDDMVTEFRRSDCMIHSVDIGGLRTGGDSGAGSVGGKDGLFMMASGTGGSFYENFNDLGQAMDRMLLETSVTYVLSYLPQDLKADGDYRKLKVKLRDVSRKAKASHRAGYFAPDPNAEVSGTEIQLRLAQRLLDGRAGGLIDTHVLAVPMRLAAEAAVGILESKAYVPVLVEVDGKSFLHTPAQLPTKKGKGRKKRQERSATDNDDPNLVRAEIFLYAMAADGAIADFFAQSVELDLRSAGDALRGRGFKLFAPLFLSQGTYDLRVLVRNSRTEQTGLQVSAVEVPDLSEVSSVLLPPLFPESNEEWLLVRGRREELPESLEPPYPFFHGGTTYVPASGPELRSGDSMPVFLAGYGLENAQGLESTLLDRAGAPVANPRWKLDPRVMVGEDGMERYVAAFEVPTAEPGEYVLELALRLAEGGTTTVGRVPITLLATGVQPQSQILALSSPVSFDQPTGSRDLPSRARVASPEAATDSPALKEVSQAYEHALARLDSAGRATLVAEVAALEARAVAENPERQVARLTRSLMRVARRVASRDPEALVPVVLLHQDLYLEHKIRRRPYLEHHSQMMVRELAELYVKKAGSQGARVVAARALSSLGGHLQADGRTASLEIFQRAVDFDPTNEAALLGLAAYYEKRGGPYGTSVGFLRQLVAHRASSREGRLRLAVNLLRVANLPGDVAREAHRKEAGALFQELLEGPEADWIFSLAAQELARYHLTENRPKEAARVLKEALKRRPADQKLRVKLVFVLDQRHRSNEARKVAESLIRDLGSAEAAPRGLYNQWPANALAEDRRELQIGANSRLGSLQAPAANSVAGDR